MSEIVETDQQERNFFTVSGPDEMTGIDEQKCSFFAAMAKAQGEMELAKKDAENKHFSSKYADLADVIAVAKKPLSLNGFCVMQIPCNRDGMIAIKTIVAHEKGATLSAVFGLPFGGNRNPAHEAGSLITYLRRYAEQSMLNIAAEDDDGNAASDAENTIQLVKSKARGLFTELQQDIDGCADEDALKHWSDLRANDVKSLPADWQNEIRARYRAALDEARKPQPNGEHYEHQQSA